MFDYRASLPLPQNSPPFAGVVSIGDNTGKHERKSFGGATMVRRKDMDPIPVTPISRTNREWSLRLVRRAAVVVLAFLVFLLVLNAVAAALGYGSF